MPKALVSRAEPDPSDAVQGARPLTGASSRPRRAEVTRRLERRLRRLGTRLLLAVFGAAALVLADGSVILLPEGSTSPERGLRRIQRGAAHGAIESRCAVSPVLISGEGPALGKGMPWYAGPNRRLGSSLNVGEPSRAKDLEKRDVASVIAARRASAALDRYFVGRVGCEYA